MPPRPEQPRAEQQPAAPTQPRTRAMEDQEGFGMALRSFGDAINEIGMRQLSEGRDLTTDEVAAARFLAESVIAWCGDEAEAARAAAPLDVNAIVRSLPPEWRKRTTIADREQFARRLIARLQESAPPLDPERSSP